MSNQSCRILPKAEHILGTDQWQVVQLEEHVDIGPLLTVWSRWHPRAEAVMVAWVAKPEHR